MHCNICGTDFSVASGGLYNVKRHIDGKKHSEMASGMTSQSTLAETLAVCHRKDALVLEDQITTAEIYFSTFIAEHNNMAFLVADHFKKLCKVMFPDSKIAEQFACGRTKTTAIVKHALAPALNGEVIKKCQSSLFTVLCDGGNDQVYKKYFAIMVRYWDDIEREPVTRFWPCQYAIVVQLKHSLVCWKMNFSLKTYHGVT